MGSSAVRTAWPLAPSLAEELLGQLVPGDPGLSQYALESVRELLLSMAWRGGLETFCARIGVRYDANFPDRSVLRVIEHYQK